MSRKRKPVTLADFSNEDLIGLFAEIYVEFRDRDLPLAPFMLDEPAHKPVEEFELSDDDALRFAALWNAYLDCRPGWMDEKCHNISGEEAKEMAKLADLAITMGERYPR